MRRTGKSAPRSIKSGKRRCSIGDADGGAELAVVVVSDGVRVPYFLIRKKGTTGPVPTILYSYGGFELSLTPWYWDDGHRPLDAGQVWVAKGGAIAVANIRGGRRVSGRAGIRQRCARTGRRRSTTSQRWDAT